MIVFGGTGGVGVLGAEKTNLELRVETSWPNLAMFTLPSFDISKL